MLKIVFYARVSTKDQRLDLQLDAARLLGVATADIFVEKASGVRHDRPELARALAALLPGDTLATYKLDRIGRSLARGRPTWRREGARPDGQGRTQCRQRREGAGCQPADACSTGSQPPASMMSWLAR